MEYSHAQENNYAVSIDIQSVERAKLMLSSKDPRW